MAETPSSPPPDPSSYDTAPSQRHTARPLSIPPRDRTPSTAPAGRQVAWTVGTHPAALELARQQQAATEAANALLPPKNALQAPPPPRVGSSLWGDVPQASLGGKTPQQVSQSWGAVQYNYATGPAARASLSRKWGRPISASEESAVPSIAAAVRKESGSPHVQDEASAYADTQVPEAKVLRAQLAAAGVPPGTEYSFR